MAIVVPSRRGFLRTCRRPDMLSVQVGCFPRSKVMTKYDKISKWVTETIESRGDLRYDDLHVDQVDPEFRKRELWVYGGMECLQLALKARDVRGAEFTVALAFSLEAGDRPLGLNFEDLTGLESQFDLSPPFFVPFPPR